MNPSMSKTAVLQKVVKWFLDADDDPDSSGVAKGGGPPQAALLWGRHYGLCCKL